LIGQALAKLCNCDQARANSFKFSQSAGHASCRGPGRAHAPAY
jgi:hypothetical protein